MLDAAIRKPDVALVMNVAHGFWLPLLKLRGVPTLVNVDGIEWEFVKCPITTPLAIHMHKGASQYWFAATVENATRRTKSLEVSVDQGKTWIQTTRNINNFFEAKDPLKGSSAWVKLTSHTDTQVIVKDVVLKSESVTKSTTNYK